MEQTISVTWTGRPEAAEGIVGAILNVLVSDRVHAVAVQSDNADMTRFVGDLSDHAIRIVRLLAHTSNAPFTAAEMCDELSMRVNDFYGYLGGIGKAWKKVSSQSNPFSARWSREKNALAWSLSDELAAQLRELLG